MSQNLPRAARNYLEQLRRALDFLSENERKQVLEQTREEIRSLPGGGRRKRELMNLLGDPAMRALKFERTEPEELEVSSGNYFLTRILAWPIFALSLLTIVVVLFSPPQDAEVGQQAALSVLGHWGGWLSDLETLVGSQLIWLAFVPAVFSLLPLWTHGATSMVLRVLGAVLMSVVCLSGGSALALYFIPVTILLWAQVFTPLLMMRGSMARPDPGWMITAAILLAAAIIFAAVAGLNDFAGSGWMIIAPCAVLVVLGILLPFRWRIAHIALVVAGLLVIVAGYVASLPDAYGATLIWPWLAGGLSFAAGHLAVAADMWHDRARKLLALF
ncbi:hypothetical protein [Glutamicibacter sp. JC586]|uniref:HAAS signaling domain-containing protein n=1 Tax=Glutamicibacter sp. JC586 TaxID=2590552 RepID=UPI001357DFD2|nr:hypothetical protein [Glutamicibacter sp. JC586]